MGRSGAPQNDDDLAVFDLGNFLGLVRTELVRKITDFGPDRITTYQIIDPGTSYEPSVRLESSDRTIWSAYSSKMLGIVN